MHVRAFDGLRLIVEGILNLLKHEVRHLPVDIAGEIDEARLDTGLLGFP